MDRNERIKIMKEVRDAVLLLTSAVFDEIDKDIVSMSYKVNNKTINNSGPLRMSLKALRAETLLRISKIGQEYEEKLDE